jgi:hypothetical protein
VAAQFSAPRCTVWFNALVTQNHESTTVLDEVEEVQRSGTVDRKEYRKVITYGVALVLDPHKDWFAANGVVRPADVSGQSIRDEEGRAS